MRHVSQKKWPLIAAFIIVSCGAIFTANYLYFIHNTPYYWKSYIGLVYEAAIASFNSTERVLDLKRLSGHQPGDLTEIHLTVEPSSLKTMVADLPESAKAFYYRASLIYPDGKVRKVKYRLRGRNMWHWMEEKPSLRIKTRKDNPINLHRHLNLVSPEDRLGLANPYGEELARKFDVLAPNTEMVRLYLNKKYKGLYQLTGREDESFLRFNKRFPGPIYVGNRLAPVWDIKDFELEGDLDVLEFSDPMAEAIDLMNGLATEENLKKFWKLVDKDKLAGWAALMAVISGTHTDFHHNQVFYLDPTTGKIEPVVSDIMALGVILYPGHKQRVFEPWKPTHTVPINERITPILAFAMADPDYVQLRNKKIQEALTSFASTEAQTDLLDRMIAKIQKAMFADPYKSALQYMFIGWHRMPFSNRQFKAEEKRIKTFIKDRNEFVSNELGRSQIALYKTEESRGRVQFTIEVSGHSAVNLNIKDLDIRTAEDPYQTLTGQEGTLLLYPELYRASAENIETPVAGRRSPEYTLRPGPKKYEFVTSEADWEKLKSAASDLFSNAVTGGNTEISSQSLITEQDSQETKHLLATVIKNPPEEERIILGPGYVRLTEDLFVPETASLTIQPGTRLHLGPGVSIISRGKVIAEGTEGRPISINRLDNDLPWGVFALVAKGANGSLISNFEASGGSSEFADHINFSGMVSVHHVQGLTLENITLSGNEVGDDTLRLISSNAKVDNLQVYNCLSDCIDFDFVEAEVRNVNVWGAGNDGFDFMSSRVDIQGYEVNKCGDKGISMGELSVITGTDISISGCIYGIAAKDQSLGKLDIVKITDSKTGIAAYKKNWRYGGPGQVFIQKPTFANNDKDEDIAPIDTSSITPGKYPTKLF